MRFALFSFVLALLTAVVMSVAPLQPVIISFPKEAPNDLLESAKKAVLDAKGKITHEYNIIKGFAAEIPESLIEGLHAMSTEFPALVEGDGIVHTQSNKDMGDKVGTY